MDFEFEQNTTPFLSNSPYFVLLSDTLQQLTDLTDRLEDPHSGYALEIKQLTVNLPIELNISINDDSSLTLSSSAPTQTTETTIFPVFHRMTLTVVPDDGQ